MLNILRCLHNWIDGFDRYPKCIIAPSLHLIHKSTDLQSQEDERRRPFVLAALNLQAVLVTLYLPGRWIDRWWWSGTWSSQLGALCIMQIQLKFNSHFSGIDFSVNNTNNFCFPMSQSLSRRVIITHQLTVAVEKYFKRSILNNVA